MNSSLCRCVAAVVLAAAGATATAQNWQPLSPHGGRVADLTAAAGAGGRVFAAGNSGMFVSTDAGSTWRVSALGLRTFGSTGSGEPAAVPGQPLRFFLFDDRSRLLRSDDGGESWAPTGYVPPAFESMTAMAASGDALMLSYYNGGFLRSTDSGVTFAPVAGLPGDQPMGLIAADPQAPDVVFAGIHIGPFSVGTAPLYRSVDGGANWQPRSNGLPAVAVSDIEFMRDGSLVVIGESQLFRSTDQGATWQPLTSMDSARVIRLSAANDELLLSNGRDCHRSGDFFATWQLCSAGLVQWTWGSFEAPALVRVALAGGGERVLASARRDGVLAYDAAANSWSPSNTRLFADSSRGLAIAPTDSNWILSGLWVVDSNAQPLLASHDGGLSWQRSLGQQARAIRSIAFDPTSLADGPAATRIYAAGYGIGSSAALSNSGIFKSSDGGASWSALDSGLLTMGNPGRVFVGMVRKVMLDPRSCSAPPAQGACQTGPLNTVFALTSGGFDSSQRVLRSTEGGANWARVGATLPAAIIDDEGDESVLPFDLELDRSGATVYLSLYGAYYNNDNTPRIPRILSGVFRSSDGGSSWAPSSSGLPLVTGSATTTRDVFALAVHPRKAGVLWATTVEAGQSSTVHRSDDGGASWAATGPALDNCDVRELQVDAAAPQVLYAAGIALNQSSGCLLRSEDSGASWTALHAQLPAIAVFDLRKDPQNSRRLVIAGDHGVWTAEAPSDRLFNDDLE